MTMKTYNIKEFAAKLGVSPRTLRRWEKRGILCACRTPSNKPFYTQQQYKQYWEQCGQFAKVVIPGKKGKDDTV